MADASVGVGSHINIDISTGSQGLPFTPVEIPIAQASVEI